MRIIPRKGTKDKYLIILSLIMIIVGIATGILLIPICPLLCNDTLNSESCLCVFYILLLSCFFVISGILILIFSFKKNW